MPCFYEEKEKYGIFFLLSSFKFRKFNMSEEGLPDSAEVSNRAVVLPTASENNYTKFTRNYRLGRWRFDFFLIPSRQIVCGIG